jgi:hypothetical protein
MRLIGTIILSHQWREKKSSRQITDWFYPAASAAKARTYRRKQMWENDINA